MNFPTSFTPPIQPQQGGGKMPSFSNPFPSMGGGAAPMSEKERMFLGALEGAMQGGNIHQQDGWAIHGGGNPMGAAMGLKKVYGDIDSEKRAEKKRKQERKERMEDRIKIFEMEEAARGKRFDKERDARLEDQRVQNVRESYLRQQGREQKLEDKAADRVLENYRRQQEEQRLEDEAKKAAALELEATGQTVFGATSDPEVLAARRRGKFATERRNMEAQELQSRIAANQALATQRTAAAQPGGTALTTQEVSLRREKVARAIDALPPGVSPFAETVYAQAILDGKSVQEAAIEAGIDPKKVKDPGAPTPQGDIDFLKYTQGR